MKISLPGSIYEGGSFVPSAKIVGNNKFSIINDYIGRPVQAYNEKGDLVWETDYDIYGDLRNLKGDRSFIPFRQLGQYEDIETSLYYNRFRYYSPNTGTYLSQDPIGIAGNNPNLYGYVYNANSQVDVFGLDVFNPITWTAPTSGTGNTYTVYQQDIDWDRLDDKGRTNLQRATKGTAPLGSDGTGKHPHFPVDRDAFDIDRGSYWRKRARVEKARRKIKCK
ncbi:RHS repeat-associated core domain-containing protein [Flavobacterium sp. MMLR14_040]|uniref:RHS repeat-associated core domain-containing protein n=1 Tax=Flavobacterium sp. MMLR14_040 TaxID=3093843 RepID=UPI00299009F4|nr:RHS repeat-associated core domain-containing protein [Flavobacterium sp. MMLR14_040]MDW8852402.1 RHS repeat-associated core domain-containing protein [Flavobacterium sp. MMLR14_040]